MSVVINYPAAGGGSGGGGGGSTTFAALTDAATANIPTINTPTATAIANRLGIPLNWNATTNTPTLASGTPPANGQDYVVTVAGTTTLDGNSSWNVGDILYFGADSLWHRIAAPPVTGTAIVQSDGSGGLVAAVSGVGYLPGPLIQTGIPVGLPPSSVVTNNGVVTFGTALTVGYPGGVWLYFPAGALYIGSLAGFYYSTATTTVATVYTNYLAASTSGMGGTGVFTIPASPTPTVATGPGAFVQTTATVFAPGASVPANTMGVNGSITVRLAVRNNTTAGNKTLQAVFGASTTTATINSLGVTTAAQTAQVATIYNRGVANAQIVPSAQDSSVFGLTLSSIDTTANQFVQLKFQLAVATDYMFAEYAQITMVPRS